MPAIETQIPDVVTLGVEDAIKLRSVGDLFNETALEYIRASIGVVGLWGYLAEKENDNPDLTYGITGGADVLHEFDMAELVAEANKLYEQGPPADPILDVRIPEQIAPYLLRAVEYYGSSFKPLLSLAIGFRKRCLIGITNGETLHYTIDDWKTYTQILLDSIRS